MILRPPNSTVPPAERSLASGDEFADREFALGQDRQHDFADGAGGADDGDVERSGTSGLMYFRCGCVCRGRCWLSRETASSAAPGRCEVMSRCIRQRDRVRRIARRPARRRARRSGCPPPARPSRGAWPGCRWRCAGSAPRCERQQARVERRLAFEHIQPRGGQTRRVPAHRPARPRRRCRRARC